MTMTADSTTISSRCGYIDGVRVEAVAGSEVLHIIGVLGQWLDHPGRLPGLHLHRLPSALTWALCGHHTALTEPSATSGLCLDCWLRAGKPPLCDHGVSRLVRDETQTHV